MGRLLKNAEEKALIKAKAEAERQGKIIHEIELKARERQGRIDAVETKHQAELNVYRYRCETYLAGEDCFTRLCWFIGQYGAQRKKYKNEEWNNIVAAAGLSELKDYLNTLGSGPLMVPKKKQVDPLED